MSNPEKFKSVTLSVTLALVILIAFELTAQAEVGIVIYGSKGMDARRTNSGHVALIVTDLCARGIDQIRECVSDEPRGVVITKYPSLAAGYDHTVFVAPLMAHFNAVSDSQLAPVLGSGDTLRNLQRQYWQNNLKIYLPPLTRERYRSLFKEQSKFRVGRLFHSLVTLEFLAKLLGSHQSRYLENSIAITDPETEELIPNGFWREAIGAQYVRDSTIITVPAEVRQELQLAEFIEHAQREPFSTLSNNCSDFAKKGLLAVFAGKGLHFRSRAKDPANAWITSPLLIATSFLDYAKRNNLPVSVIFRPMLAGTGRPSTSIMAISQGALVPSPDQGKLAFSVKLYINALNPLIGATAFVVVKSSQFADLDELAHESGASTLPRVIADAVDRRSPFTADLRTEQVRAFGTSSCWDRKKKDFLRLTSQAVEIGLLTREEKTKLLAQGRPFLLPRFYESLAKTKAPDIPLMTGISLCQGTKCGVSFDTSSLPASSRPRMTVPNRSEIQSMTRSEQPSDRLAALRLMISVINYDLASEPRNRRRSASFDEDWKLYLNVAQGTGMLVEPEAREGLEECSMRELRGNPTKVDAIKEESAIGRQMVSWFRRLVVSPSR